MLSVSTFLTVFDGQVITVALPAISADLGLAPSDAQWVLTAYVLTVGGFLLVGGRLGDRFGRRPILLIGLAAFAGGLVTQSLGWQYVFLLSTPVAASAALAAAVLPGGRLRDGPCSVDVWAALLATAGVAALVAAITTVGRPGMRVVALLEFSLAAALVVVFLLRERRTPTPLLRLGLVRVRTFRAAVAVLGRPPRAVPT
ncbi:MFS transporter [Jiangella aurantiaca]|uniref:MFS transporter n=1 Tax=Jiangella aurantiaca TaxID=2530373 RepID=UPI0013A5F07F|nr:MFS transporter [Jiangella aurantiaca]